jgi:hypothetical protein
MCTFNSSGGSRWKESQMREGKVQSGKILEEVSRDGDEVYVFTTSLD